VYTRKGLVLEPFQLALQPIPVFARGENCRGRWSKTDWTRLRQALWRKAGYKCEACKQGDATPELHEVWQPLWPHEPADEDAQALCWLLDQLVCLCPTCHAACHLSMWQVRSIDDPIAALRYHTAASHFERLAGLGPAQLIVVQQRERALDDHVSRWGFTLDLTVCHRAMNDSSLYT